jgi:transcriptional regulator
LKQLLSQIRSSYESQVAGLKAVVDKLRNAGKTTEEIARTVAQMRREIGMTHKAVMSEAEQATVFARNIEKYGDPLGPIVEYLLEKGKTFEDIIESECRTGGKDLGL